MLHTTAFQGTAMALSPYGKTEAINALTREDVVNFADDHFKGSRVVIAAAGGVDHAKINAFAEKSFGHLDNKYKRHVPPAHGVRFTGSEFVYRNDYIPYMYSAVAVEGVPIGHPDALPLKLAVHYVGQWDQTHGTHLNSPVKAVQKLSQLPGLISYNPFSVNYTDTGLFGYQYVSTGEDQDHANKTTGAIQKVWKHLAVALTDEEVDRTKNQLRTSLLAPLEDNAALAHYLATETLGKGEPTNVADVERAIRFLDAASVREAMSRHVYDRDLAISGVGRTEALPNYVNQRLKMSWWRL